MGLLQLIFRSIDGYELLALSSDGRYWRILFQFFICVMIIFTSTVAYLRIRIYYFVRHHLQVSEGPTTAPAVLKYIVGNDGLISGFLIHSWDEHGQCTDRLC